jgi:hypothetical protein
MVLRISIHFVPIRKRARCTDRHEFNRDHLQPDSPREDSAAASFTGR